VNAVRESTRTVHWLIRAVVIVAAACSLGYALVEGHEPGLLTLPVLLQAVLVVVALEVARALDTGLRIDALTLFTAWEAMRGCVAPVLIQFVGNGTSFYYRLGTYADTRFVLFLAILFFAVVVATRVVAGLVRRRTPVAARPLTPSRIPPWMLIALGGIGMVIRFPTPVSVQEFLSGSIAGLQGTGAVSSSGIVLVGMLLRPLLFVGLVVLLRNRRRAGRRWLWLVVPILVSIVFGLASYGLNRATVAYAVIGVALVFLERARRAIRLVPTATVLGLLGTFFVGVGTLRSTLWVSRTGLAAPEVGFIPILQSVIPYFGTPMQLAASLPPVRVSDPFGLGSFLLSLLSPIPGAPSEARTGSSTALYNNVVYHSFVGKDQLLPTWFEGYLCFGVIGVVLAGIAVALLQVLSDAMRRRLSTVLGAYAGALFVLWIAQAGVTSFGVVEQNLIYFILTPLALAGAARLWPSRPLPLLRTERPSS
jgi:hypothetical protein